MTKLQIKNPVGMKADDLRTYATELGLEFTEDVSYNDLRDAVLKKNAELRVDNPDPQDNDKNATQANTGSQKAYFYWVKYPVYVNDDPNLSEKRLPAGLYKFDNELPRLKGKTSNAFQLFVNEIPERTLIKIAETRGIKFSETDKIDVDDLLVKLLTEPNHI